MKTNLVKSDLVKAAKELNDALGLDPQIQVKGASMEDLKRDVEEAGRLIEPTDDVSEETMDVVNVLILSKSIPQKNTSKVDADVDTNVDLPIQKQEQESAKSKPKSKQSIPTVVVTNNPVNPVTTIKTNPPVNPAPTNKTIKEGVKDKPPLAHLMDEVLEKGGSWEYITNEVQKLASEYDYDPKKCTTGSIRAHAKYRISKGTLKIKLTEDGVEQVK